MTLRDLAKADNSVRRMLIRQAYLVKIPCAQGEAFFYSKISNVVVHQRRCLGQLRIFDKIAHKPAIAKRLTLHCILFLFGVLQFTVATGIVFLDCCAMVTYAKCIECNGFV